MWGHWGGGRRQWCGVRSSLNLPMTTEKYNIFYNRLKNLLQNLLCLLQNKHTLCQKTFKYEVKSTICFVVWLKPLGFQACVYTSQGIAKSRESWAQALSNCRLCFSLQHQPPRSVFHVCLCAANVRSVLFVSKIRLGRSTTVLHK